MVNAGSAPMPTTNDRKKKTDLPKVGLSGWIDELGKGF